MTFNNEKQLKKFIIDKCSKAVASAENKVYTELAGNLNQFYSEFSPEYYIRTGSLFNSLDLTNVVSTGDGVWAEVYFDTPSYQNGKVLLQDGSYGNAYWDGETVLRVALTGILPHGGWEDGTAIWTESMDSLGGRQGIKDLLKRELKKQGL